MYSDLLEIHGQPFVTFCVNRHGMYDCNRMARRRKHILPL